jgi:tetratricopeptide (TPR) repeat protein
MHFLHEPFNSQENSIGDASLKLRFAFALLLLLAGDSFGQQEASLPSILADAQKAQSANDYTTAMADYKQAVKIRRDVPELWANLGLMQHETGDYEGAIQSFKEANRIQPALYVPNLFLGIDYVHTGKQKEAVPLLLKAEKMNDTDPLPSLTLGRAYSSLGEYRLAAKELERTIRIDPKQSSAWFALGIVYLHQVEQDSRTMTERDADSGYAKALYAEALVKQDRYKEAADLYQQAMAAKDRPDCVQSEEGFLNIRQGKPDDAAKDFQVERETHPECTMALLGQARLKIDSGEKAEAATLLQQAWKRDETFLRIQAENFFSGMKPDDVRSFEEYLSQQSGAIAEALQQRDQALLPSNSDSASLPFSLAEAERDFRGGHDQSCAEHLRGSLKNSNAEALRLLAACACNSGNYQLASGAGAALAGFAAQSPAALYWSIKANEKLAQQSLASFQQLEPNSARSHLLMGDIYRQRERFGDAEKEYEKALQIAPKDTGGLLGLASALLGDAKIDQAIETAGKSLARTPDDPETNVVMGEALIAQHRFAEAEPYLTKGLHAKPQMLPHVHALLGETYAAEGRTDDAIEEMKLGLSSDEDGGLHYQLARLYAKTGAKASADVAMAQMKVLQQRRRQASVIAVEDSHSSSLDDAP